MKTKTSPWRHIYHDIEIPRPKKHSLKNPSPKNCDIDVRVLKHHPSRKERQLNHNIENQGIFSNDENPRHPDSKTEKPRHRDSKTKKPRHQVTSEF